MTQQKLSDYVNLILKAKGSFKDEEGSNSKLPAN